MTTTRTARRWRAAVAGAALTAALLGGCSTEEDPIDAPGTGEEENEPGINQEEEGEGEEEED